MVGLGQPWCTQQLPAPGEWPVEVVYLLLFRLEVQSVAPARIIAHQTAEPNPPLGTSVTCQLGEEGAVVATGLRSTLWPRWGNGIASHRGVGEHQALAEDGGCQETGKPKMTEGCAGGRRRKTRRCLGTSQDRLGCIQAGVSKGGWGGGT